MPSNDSKRKKKSCIKNSTLVNTERKEGELVRGNSFGGWYKEWRERAAVPAPVLWNVGKREREKEKTVRAVLVATEIRRVREKKSCKSKRIEELCKRGEAVIMAK